MAENRNEGPELDGRSFDLLFDQIAKDADPELRNRIKKRMRPIMAQYLRLPAISLELTIRPGELDEAAIKALSDQINAQIRAAVWPFFTEMLRDLCFAEAKLCQFEGTSSLGDSPPRGGRVSRPGARDDDAGAGANS